MNSSIFGEMLFQPFSFHNVNCRSFVLIFPVWPVKVFVSRQVLFSFQTRFDRYIITPFLTVTVLFILFSYSVKTYQASYLIGCCPAESILIWWNLTLVLVSQMTERHENCHYCHKNSSIQECKYGKYVSSCFVSHRIR